MAQMAVRGRPTVAFDLLWSIRVSMTLITSYIFVRELITTVIGSQRYQYNNQCLRHRMPVCIPLMTLSLVLRTPLNATLHLLPAHTTLIVATPLGSAPSTPSMPYIMAWRVTRSTQRGVLQLPIVGTALVIIFFKIASAKASLHMMKPPTGSRTC